MHTFFMPPKELWEACSNYTINLSRLSVPLDVGCISPSIFFEVGNPNLVRGGILECRSVVYHPMVIVTLT